MLLRSVVFTGDPTSLACNNIILPNATDPMPSVLHTVQIPFTNKIDFCWGNSINMVWKLCIMTYYVDGQGNKISLVCVLSLFKQFHRSD